MKQKTFFIIFKAISVSKISKNSGHNLYKHLAITTSTIIDTYKIVLIRNIVSKIRPKTRTTPLMTFALEVDLFSTLR